MFVSVLLRMSGLQTREDAARTQAEHLVPTQPKSTNVKDYQSKPISTPVASHAHIGDTATVIESNGFWPCGSTPEALDELTKWAVRGDHSELMRTMRSTRSIGLMGGMQVKVLDSRGFLAQIRRVRVLTNASGESSLHDEQGFFAADPRIGRECWIDSETLR